MQQQQQQQEYATYRTLPAQYDFGPPDGSGFDPSYGPPPPVLLPQQQQQQQQPQPMATSYGPPPASVSYQSTYTPHLQHIQHIEHSPISYMGVDEPLSGGGIGLQQHSPTRSMVTGAVVAADVDMRKLSSSTNRMSFSTDGGPNRAPTAAAGRKASLATAAKETVVLEEDEGDGKKKRKRVERACCTSRLQLSSGSAGGRRLIPSLSQSPADRNGPSATASSPVRSASTTSSTASTRRRRAKSPLSTFKSSRDPQPCR